MSALEPVTVERLELELTRAGYRYEISPEGVLSGTWEGQRFTVSLIGPKKVVLQVRGTWERTVPARLWPQLAQALNDWNRDRIWPKVYSRPHGTGHAVQTEVSVDMELGGTDAQLHEAVACGLGTGVQFFTALAEVLDPALEGGED